MRKLIILCLAGLIAFPLSGCVSRPEKQIDQIILDEQYYTTDKGREFAQRYRANLERIVAQIRSRHAPGDLEFVNPSEGRNAEGLFFGYQMTDPEKNIYLIIRMYSTVRYNTLQTDYNGRAASTFLRFGRDLFDLVSSDRQIMSNNDICGICVSLQWIAANFFEERYFGGTWEGIGIWTSKSVCDDFINNNITNQEFMNKNKVFGWQDKTFLGLIETDLGKGL